VSGTLAILAFDHRHSFLPFLGAGDPPSDADRERASAAKTVVAAGLVEAVTNGSVPREAAGALVDATYGQDAIASLRATGVRVAIPVVVSGAPELAFEDGWRERIATVDPAWVKVLVRDNPAGEEARGDRQRARLRELHDACAAEGRALMLELLVPAEPDQEGPGYDVEVRPGLMATAIERIREAGVRPAMWKLEGFERREDAAAVAAAAGGPCVVLGRGQDAEAVDRWLRVAAEVDGFVGFAIGRTIWAEPLRTWLGAGAGDDARIVAVDLIAKGYAHAMEVFEGAAVDR
jgi:myo-inositol catabolism protein IolC